MFAVKQRGPSIWMNKHIIFMYPVTKSSILCTEWMVAERRQRGTAVWMLHNKTFSKRVSYKIVSNLHQKLLITTL